MCTWASISFCILKFINVEKLFLFFGYTNIQLRNMTCSWRGWPGNRQEGSVWLWSSCKASIRGVTSFSMEVNDHENIPFLTSTLFLYFSTLQPPFHHLPSLASHFRRRNVFPHWKWSLCSDLSRSCSSLCRVPSATLYIKPLLTHQSFSPLSLFMASTVISLLL